MTTATATPTRKCAVLYRRSLLAQGVASLLRMAPNLEVTVLEADRDDVPGVMRRKHIDVLIVELDDVRELGGMIAQLLREHPHLRVMCLNPMTDVVHILRPETRSLRSSQELVASIRE